MQVGDLRLEDFRNYEREQVDFAPGLNLVVGRNAQGKTNLLEAVHCLSGLGSPRGPDASLVRAGAERALIHARMSRGDRWIDVDMEIRPGRGTRALINKVATPRTRNLGELVVTVFFGPDELSLVKGSPDGRRRFLDELIVKLRPAREQLRREWERVLKQRNALLKSSARGRSSNARETLEVWDEAFCRTGAALAAARLNALAALIPYATKRYEEVAGRGSLGLDYVSSWVTEEVRRDSLASGAADTDVLERCLRARLTELATAELERGLSLAGPQRDDVSVQLPAEDGSGVWLDARAFASQGDQRTAALALKLAEHDLLTNVLGQHPILLLDDVFSELDPHRRTWLAEAVRGMGQTLLSSAEPPTEELQADRVLQVSHGKVLDG